MDNSFDQFSMFECPLCGAKDNNMVRHLSQIHWLNESEIINLLLSLVMFLYKKIEASKELDH